MTAPAHDVYDVTEQLYDVFRKHYPEQSTALYINAVEIANYHPQLASLMLRIDAASKEMAGRARALEFIGSVLTETSVRGYPPQAALSPNEIRAEAQSLWARADTKNDLMRAWALTNAAQETGTNMEEFQSRKRETMCERFHERHVAPHFHGDSYTFGDFWHDTFYADEYWRGLAAYCILGDWDEDKPSIAFILWAGQQKNLNTVVRLVQERDTIDPLVLAPVLELRETIHHAVPEGLL